MKHRPLVNGRAAPAKGQQVQTGGAAGSTGDDVHGPSPNEATNLAIADIALRGGSILARRALEQAVLGKKLGPRQAKSILRGRTLGETMLHGVLARVALRSVPGAIVVGGALAAKTLYDRRKARLSKRKGNRQLADMARSGED